MPKVATTDKNGLNSFFLIFLTSFHKKIFKEELNLYTIYDICIFFVEGRTY